jgi:hypothetical protein
VVVMLPVPVNVSESRSDVMELALKISPDARTVLASIMNDPAPGTWIASRPQRPFSIAGWARG